jgi:hypothetical protein
MSRSASTPTDDLDRLFRQAYQVIVDRTELPDEDIPSAPLQPSIKRRARGPVVALVAAAAVLALGGLAFLTRDANQFSGPVERIALVEPPPSLGGDPVVVDSNTIDGRDFDPLPAADMWIWERADSEGSSVAVLEMEIGVDTTTLLGQTEGAMTLVPPDPGEVEVTMLPNFGWHAASWIAGDRWRIAVGYHQAEVSRLAHWVGDQEPSTVGFDGFELAYEGPQVLPAAADGIWDLVYRSPAGEFSVDLVQGWTDAPTTLAPLMTADPDHVEINGTPAVVGGDENQRWIVWQAGEGSTAFVETVDLPRDLLRSVAEGVRPVSVAEWEAMAATVASD